MACPNCKCETTYYFTIYDIEDDYEMEKCANCNTVFYIYESSEDNDVEPDEVP